MSRAIISLLSMLTFSLLSCSTESKEAPHTQKAKTVETSKTNDEATQNDSVPVADTTPNHSDFTLLSPEEIDAYIEGVISGKKEMTPEVAGLIKAAEARAQLALESDLYDIRAMQLALEGLERTKDGAVININLIYTLTPILGLSALAVVNYKLLPSFEKAYMSAKNTHLKKKIEEKILQKTARKITRKLADREKILDSLRKWLNHERAALSATTQAMYAEQFAKAKKSVFFKNKYIRGASFLLVASFIGVAYVECDHAGDNLTITLDKLEAAKANLKALETIAQQKQAQWDALYKLLHLEEVEMVLTKELNSNEIEASTEIQIAPHSIQESTL